MSSDKEQKRLDKAHKKHHKHTSLVSRLLTSLFDSTIETPFEVILSHYRVAILVFHILSVLISISLAITKLIGQSNTLIFVLLLISLIGYGVLILFYIIFFIQENKKKKKDRRVSWWSINKKQVLAVVKVLITLLSISVSISLIAATHQFDKTGSDPSLSVVVNIIVFVYSILILIINSIMIVFQIYKIVKAIHHRKELQKEAATQELKKQKRRQIYMYLQHELRQFQEFSLNLNEKFHKLEAVLDKRIETKTREDDMHLLVKLKDDQYEDNGTNHIYEDIRLIVVNHNNKIAIVNVDEKHDEFGPRKFFQLPGGKVKPWETLRDALVRIVIETIGIKVNLTEELGRVDDAYNVLKRENHNYFFIVETVNDSNLPSKLLNSDNKIIWVSFEKAISFYEKMPNTLLSRLVKNRELPVIRLASHEVSNK